MTARGIATPIPAFAPVERPEEFAVVFGLAVDVVDVGEDVGKLAGVAGASVEVTFACMLDVVDTAVAIAVVVGICRVSVALAKSSKSVAL